LLTSFASLRSSVAYSSFHTAEYQTVYVHMYMCLPICISIDIYVCVDVFIYMERLTNILSSVNSIIFYLATMP